MHHMYSTYLHIGHPFNGNANILNYTKTTKIHEEMFGFFDHASDEILQLHNYLFQHSDI